MGQKVNPHGLRVGVIKDWDSRWYASDEKVGDLIVEDQKIRKYMKKTLYGAGVPKIEIERRAATVTIYLHCARPGVVSAKGGEHGLYRPQIEFDNADSFVIGDVKVERIAVEHGFPCCGYVLSGRLAYVSDCHELPEATVEKLKGVDTLVLNCLREREHPTHLSLQWALGYVERIAPRRTYLHLK